MEINKCIYRISFLDEKLIQTESWIHDLISPIRIEINDKIKIDRYSFEENLFVQQNTKDLKNVIKELKSIITKIDNNGDIDGLSLIFKVKDIIYEYTMFGSINNNIIGEIILEKLKP